MVWPWPCNHPIHAGSLHILISCSIWVLGYVGKLYGDKLTTSPSLVYMCLTPTGFFVKKRSRSQIWSRILKVSVSEGVVMVSEGVVLVSESLVSVLVSISDGQISVLVSDFRGRDSITEPSSRNLHLTQREQFALKTFYSVNKLRQVYFESFCWMNTKNVICMPYLVNKSKSKTYISRKRERFFV